MKYWQIREKVINVYMYWHEKLVKKQASEMTVDNEMILLTLKKYMSVCEYICCMQMFVKMFLEL